MCDAPIPKFCEEVDPERQPSTPKMATLLPPPKRQKLYHGVPEPEPELPKASPNVVVQFVSEEHALDEQGEFVFNKCIRTLTGTGPTFCS